MDLMFMPSRFRRVFQIVIGEDFKQMLERRPQFEATSMFVKDAGDGLFW